MMLMRYKFGEHFQRILKHGSYSYNVAILAVCTWFKMTGLIGLVKLMLHLNYNYP